MMQGRLHDITDVGSSSERLGTVLNLMSTEE